jgi:hypothetical protein
MFYTGSLSLLLLAAFPTTFGRYVFFYLPLLILLIVGGVARMLSARTRGRDRLIRA